MRHRKAKRYRGNHRLGVDPRARYAVVVATALIGAAIIAIGAGTALPEPKTQAASAAVTTEANGTVTGQGAGQQEGSNGGNVGDANGGQNRASAPAPDKLPDWTRPSSYRISSTFGYRNFVENGRARGREFHGGLDFAAPLGSPVKAASSGTVRKASWNGGYGKLVIIDHGGGVVTYYGHNSKILVSVGQYVQAGDVISKVGSTGDSTGPHCHLEVRINGERTDPAEWLREHGVPL